MILYIDSLQIYKSVHEVLRELMANYTLGLVTNFAYYPGAYQMIDRFTLKSYFKVIVVSGEIGWKKPSQQIFNIALSELSISAEETLFIGDDYEADIKGSKKVGMKTIYLCKNPTNNEEADATIGSLTEIPSAIKRLLQ